MTEQNQDLKLDRHRAEDTKKRLILDCDPGHDDAVAIMLAQTASNLKLNGLVIVAGNQTLEKTVTNALHVVNDLEYDVPVYAGCGQPLVRARMIAKDIHGETGLDGPVFQPLGRRAEEKSGVQYLVDAISSSPEKMTVVTTGPMTDLALAMRLRPEICENIDEIVVMGGTYQLGNVTPAAEFNIVADPEAADIVFRSGCCIVMVGLDVTRKVLCLPSVVDRMEKMGTKESDLFVALMRFFNKTQKEVFGWEGGPLHDPLTIAYLIDPSVLTLQPMHVEVDLSHGPSYGRTNCDFFDYFHREKNVQVATEVDVARFWDIVEQGLRGEK